MSKDEPIEVELKDMVRASSTKEFNIVVGSTLAISMVFLFLSALFGDAFVNIMIEEETNDGVRVPVWERYKLPYETDGDFGVALEVGPY